MRELPPSGSVEADDRLAARRARGAAQELALRGQAAVVLAALLVGADLAGEVDRKGLRHRDHAVLRGDHRRLADGLDRLEGEQRVAVDQVVQAPRTHREAGHDLAALHEARRQAGRGRILTHGDARIFVVAGVRETTDDRRWQSVATRARAVHAGTLCCVAALTRSPTPPRRRRAPAARARSPVAPRARSCPTATCRPWAAPV